MQDVRDLAPGELPSYLRAYIAKAEGPDLISALEGGAARALALFKVIPPERQEYRYAPGKWSIKEVIQHVNDSERIFAYRALRFARKDTTPLPGFEENDYAPASDADRRSLRSLCDEHEAVRRSSILLFQSFAPEMLMRRGQAAGNSVSVEALGWIIAGHAMHHWSIIRERYL